MHIHVKTWCRKAVDSATLVRQQFWLPLCEWNSTSSLMLISAYAFMCIELSYSQRHAWNIIEDDEITQAWPSEQDKQIIWEWHSILNASKQFEFESLCYPSSNPLYLLRWDVANRHLPDIIRQRHSYFHDPQHLSYTIVNVDLHFWSMRNSTPLFDHVIAFCIDYSLLMKQESTAVSISLNLFNFSSELAWYLQKWINKDIFFFRRIVKDRS